MAGLTQFVIITLVLYGACELNAEESLRVQGDFNAQVMEIVERSQLRDEDYAVINDAVHSIQQLLQTRWPEAKLTPFGSICTGLATRDSDIDSYAYIPNSDTNSTLAEETASILSQYPQLFADIHLKGKRIPKVRGVHVPSRRSFDISFTGPSSLRNTRLVTYLISRDPTLLNLAKIIKYWTNIRKFNDITQYVFTIMTIFFLQQKGILPPISDLQKNVKPLVLENWNTAFEERKINATTEELSDLLVGFFEYYAMFDYDGNVISPFVGYPVSRARFEDVDSLPKDYELYKLNVVNNITSPLSLGSVLVVQDPFDLNRNVGLKTSVELSVADVMRMKIITEIRKAYKKYLQNRNPDKLLELILQE